MEDPIDRGLPFVIGDMWPLPAFAEPADDESSIFNPIDAALLPLELSGAISSQGLAHFEFVFDLPSFLEQNSSPEPDLHPSENLEGQPDKSDEGSELSIWNVGGLLDRLEQPKLCTWEAFHKKDSVHSSERALLSEAGPRAFDVALRSLGQQNSIGVLPQDYALRSLCTLVLGRASSLFQWDESKAQFVPTLEGAYISGLSSSSSASLVDSLANMGSLVSRLRAFADSRHIDQRQSPAKSALRSCTAIILSALDQSISRELESVHSLLQLQSLVHKPQKLLRTLENVVQQIKNARDDNTIISSISQCVAGDILTEHHLRQVFETLLAQVSVPWFERLARSIGFPDPANAFMLSNSDNDDDNVFMASMPTFVTSEDAVLLQETNEAVRLLRTNSPTHILLTYMGENGVESPFHCFADTSISNTEAFETALRYESRNSGTRPYARPSTITSHQQKSHSSDGFWIKRDHHVAYLSELDAIISGNIESSNAGGAKLHDQTLIACRADKRWVEMGALALDVGTTTAPLERVRPLVLAQNRLVNAVLLQQLFKEHHLSDHLDLQQQFHLFGNGDFVTRLSTALFSVDVQSAERRRGKTPTAETMGLRLGITHEERWPPASSELQLTLMGILTESCNTKKARSFQEQPEARQLPGKLSFAIRQLPEKDIEGVLDPNSIYALDFLRLQYNTKSPLDAVFTASALESYDQIFCFLLRLLRLNHITATLPRKAMAVRRNNISTYDTGFIIQARTFVTILAAHMVDVGTAAPWRAFMSEIGRIERDLEDEDGVNRPQSSARISMQGLRQLHSACLARMRSRLFLKRKQETVRLAIEDVLSTILRAAFSLQTENTTESVTLRDAQMKLRRSIQTLHSLLQDVARKPAKVVDALDAEDADMAKMLLLKLDWNCFYGNVG